MKTHKQAGDVDVRPIHAGNGSPYYALGAMVGARIRQETWQQPWLCRTTDDVIKQLNDRQLDNDIFMCKVDIKDFYLQGDPTAISRDAAKLFWQFAEYR